MSETEFVEYIETIINPDIAFIRHFHSYGICSAAEYFRTSSQEFGREFRHLKSRGNRIVRIDGKIVSESDFKKFDENRSGFRSREHLLQIKYALYPEFIANVHFRNLVRQIYELEPIFVGDFNIYINIIRQMIRNPEMFSTHCEIDKSIIKKMETMLKAMRELGFRVIIKTEHNCITQDGACCDNPSSYMEVVNDLTNLYAGDPVLFLYFPPAHQPRKRKPEPIAFAQPKPKPKIDGRK